jgi:glycerate kinase
MAKSSGVSLLKSIEKNPLITSTYGFGIVIKRILEMGINQIIAGIGGSATNDVGVGMLSALGYKFLDINGSVIDPKTISGKDLIDIYSIDNRDLFPLLDKLNIRVACDVNNPLYGPSGATHVFSYQKGADYSTSIELEKGVIHFSNICEQHFGYNLSSKQGSGAAGGMGFALRSFLNAKLTPGWKLIFNILNIEEHIKDADLIITGEGRVDGQSLSGKLLNGVITLTERYNKKLWVFCGSNLLTNRELNDNNIDRIFSISDIEPDKERAISNAKEYLQQISLNAATFLNEI